MIGIMLISFLYQVDFNKLLLQIYLNRLLLLLNFKVSFITLHFVNNPDPHRFLDNSLFLNVDPSFGQAGQDHWNYPERRMNFFDWLGTKEGSVLVCLFLALVVVYNLAKGQSYLIKFIQCLNLYQCSILKQQLTCYAKHFSQYLLCQMSIMINFIDPESIVEFNI